MDKIKDITLLFFAGSNGSPDTLTPAHTSVSASTLCYPSVNHHRTNLSLSAIVSRLNFWDAQKAELTFPYTIIYVSPATPLSIFSDRISHYSQQFILFAFTHWVLQIRTAKQS